MFLSPALTLLSLSPDSLSTILGFLDLRTVLTACSHLNRLFFALTHGCTSSSWPLDVKVRELHSVLGDLQLAHMALLWPRLRSLDLSRCALVTDSAVAVLARHCPQLQSLTLAHCSAVGDTAMMHIATSGWCRAHVCALSICSNFMKTAALDSDHESKFHDVFGS